MTINIGSKAQKDWKKQIKVHPLLAARFAFHMKKKREDRKLNLQGMADLCGVSNPYIYMLETGQRTPSIDFVEKVAGIFNVDPASMLEDPK